MNFPYNAISVRRVATGLFLAGVTAAGVVATPAEARDRPGTPNNEKAYACGNHLAQLPQICVEFYNTASERVTFETEVTRDGVPLPPGTLATLCPRQFSCHVGLALAGGRFGIATEGRTGSGSGLNYVWPEGFIVKDVEPRVEHCFRFRARRVSDQVVSERWSNWACAAGRDLPPKPSPPVNVSAQYFPATWVGNTPYANRVVLKWSNSANAASFTVHGQTHPYGEWVGTYADAEWTKSYRGGRPDYADTVIVRPEVVAAGGNPVEFCAHNVSGKACVRTLVSRLVDPQTHVVDAPNAGAEALRQPPRLRATTQPLPAPGRKDEPLPVATPPKLGILGPPSAGASVLRAQPKVLQQPTASQPPAALPVPASEAPAAQRGSAGASVLRAALPVTTVPVPQVAPAASGTCKPGYVWRAARPTDLVCVEPPARARVAEENRLAPTLVQPGGGAYGPNTCRSGYVWREAFAGDGVCVTPAARALAAEENRLAAGRRAGAVQAAPAEVVSPGRLPSKDALPRG